MSTELSAISSLGIIKALLPWIVVLIIAVVLIIVIFGAKPNIGGLQL